MLNYTTESDHLLPTQQENIYQLPEQIIEREAILEQSKERRYTIIMFIHYFNTIFLVSLSIVTLIIWFSFWKVFQWFGCKDCSSEFINNVYLVNWIISILSVLSTLLWIILKIYLLISYQKRFSLFIITEFTLTVLFLIFSIIFYVVGAITQTYYLASTVYLSIVSYNVAVVLVNVILFNFFNIIPYLVKK